VYRYRENYKNLIKSASQDLCALCNITTHKYIYSNEHASIIANKYPYDIWEHRSVVEHLLIVPKIHTAALHDLPKEAQISILELIGKFEKLGYDIYARSVGSNMRSIPSHQHTHLIKTSGNCANLSIYVKKPYVVAKF
jgi:diadenosine tetraphosphate (Ap4A) HIT family hydrolase